MTILRDDDARFQRLERKVGIFVLLALAGIILTVIVIGARQDLFTPKTRIFFVSDTGQDLNVGMAVKLSGFDIGKVERLALTDSARVRVTLAIQSQYMKWIRTTSRARLLKEGVIGANIIEVTPGADTARPLAEDSEITFERERGLSAVVDQLYAEIVPILNDLKRVVHNADVLMAGLPETREKLDVVLDSAARNLKSLEKFTASDLPAIGRSGRETVEGAKKVVDSLGRTWPISSGMEPPRSKLLPQDSYGSASPAPQKPNP
jgi:phospholipid/cholesterol/gamma-HCH transport system substrate-binding protein